MMNSTAPSPCCPTCGRSDLTISDEVVKWAGKLGFAVESWGEWWLVIDPDGDSVGGAFDTRSEARHEAYRRARQDEAWTDDDKWARFLQDFPLDAAAKA